MQIEDILEKAGDNAGARRVFGEPYEKDGITLIPAARVVQGGGGGSGVVEGEEGGGGGFGLIARPVGAYRIEDGQVSWVPAVDATRIALFGQLVGIVALLVARSIFKHLH